MKGKVMNCQSQECKRCGFFGNFSLFYIYFNLIYYLVCYIIIIKNLFESLHHLECNFAVLCTVFNIKVAASAFPHYYT